VGLPDDDMEMSKHVGMWIMQRQTIVIYNFVILICICGYNKKKKRKKKKRNTEAHSCNHCCNEKAISITYSESVFSLRYPACNALAPYCHLWPVRLYNIFATLSHKRHDLRNKCYWTQNVCFDFLDNVCLKHLIPRRIKRDMMKNV
jgi:hypothetical protein